LTLELLFSQMNASSLDFWKISLSSPQRTVPASSSPSPLGNWRLQWRQLLTPRHLAWMTYHTSSTRQGVGPPLLEACNEMLASGQCHSTRFTTVSTQTVQVCWDRVLASMEHTLRLWGSRRLDMLAQRVQVQESFIMSKAWYLLSFFHSQLDLHLSWHQPPDFDKSWQIFSGRED
jgi:hypothetical protein